ncbi:MAG: hypothetical protein R3C03_19010 [Pirellulaceae bacterium]
MHWVPFHINRQDKWQANRSNLDRDGIVSNQLHVDNQSTVAREILQPTPEEAWDLVDRGQDRNEVSDLQIFSRGDLCQLDG